MLRQPDPAKGETFRAGGLIDANRSVASERRLEELMARVAARMRRTPEDMIWDTKITPGDSTRNWENPSIPSGYTYLLQLIGNDLVEPVPAVDLSDVARPAFRNGRVTPLVLDTIYGMGPDHAAHAYEISQRHRDSSGCIPRTRLRLGDLKANERPSEVTRCPFRDIARVAKWGERNTREFPDWLTEPLIADRRNDAHALLSQLTVLFHTLHNAVIDLVEWRHGMVIAASESWTPESEVEITYRRFLCARLVVTVIYRNIIEKDVLRRILHPDVYAAYTSDPTLRLDQNCAPSLEFSHGALRFVHAVVRNAYRVNSDIERPIGEALDQTSCRKPLTSGSRVQPNVPVSSKWAVDWQRFFGEDGSPVNLSRRIGPSYAAALSEPPEWDCKSPQYDFRSLAEHDLLNASLSGLWSVPALTKEMRARLDERGLSWLLPAYESWHEPLRAWLEGTQGNELSTRYDASELIEDPPLPFFILFEAAHQVEHGKPRTVIRCDGGMSFPGQGGQHLGPFGSLIVADSIFGALRSQPFGFDEMAVSFKQRIERCCSILGTPKLLADVIPQIDTMPKLLDFMSRLDGTFLR